MIPLGDLKDALNMKGTDGSHDAELQRHLDAALQVAEGYVGPLTPRSRTDVLFDVYGPTVVLRDAPVLSVETLNIAPYPGTTPTVQDVTALLLDGAAGILRLASGRPVQGVVTVTYTVGQDIPRAVSEGIVELAAHRYGRTQQYAGSSVGGQVGADPDVDTAPGMYSGIPYGVLDLWRPYLRAPRVA